MKPDVVYLKDLVKRLDGATLRDVAGLELKIQPTFPNTITSDVA